MGRFRGKTLLDILLRGRPSNYTLYIYIPDDCRTGSQHIIFCAFFELGKSSHHFEYGGFTELAAVWAEVNKKKKAI